MIACAAYVLGRVRGRLLHMDEVCEAERQGYELGYEAGVKHGLEAALMSDGAKLRMTASRQRRGIVHALN